MAELSEEDPWADVEIARGSFSLAVNNSNDMSSTTATQDPPIMEDPDANRRYSLILLKRMVTAWIVFDVLMGAIGWIFVPLLETAACPKTLLVILAVAASSLLLRSVLAVTAMTFEVFQRKGLLWSAYASHAFILLQGLLAAVVAVEHRKVAQWLYDSQFLPPQQPMRVLARHVQYIWIVLLILCATEYLRYQLFYRHREVLLRRDRNDLLRVSPELLLLPSSSSPNSDDGHNRRPWWWQTMRGRNDGNNDEEEGRREPLLQSGLAWAENTDPYNPTPPPRRFFAALRGGNSNNNNNNSDPREEGSVDFESVQEEWASRDEEDPHWWSREEEAANNNNNNNSKNPKTSTNDPASSVGTSSSTKASRK